MMGPTNVSRARFWVTLAAATLEHVVEVALRPVRAAAYRVARAAGLILEIHLADLDTDDTDEVSP